MPVWAVTGAGTETVNSGSTRATRGIIASDRRLFFTAGASTEITAFFVASLPVPAVVGIAIMGSGGTVSCRPLPTPSR